MINYTIVDDLNDWNEGKGKVSLNAYKKLEEHLEKINANVYFHTVRFVDDLNDTNIKN